MPIVSVDCKYLYSVGFFVAAILVGVGYFFVLLIVFFSKVYKTFFSWGDIVTLNNHFRIILYIPTFYIQLFLPFLAPQLQVLVSNALYLIVRCL